MGSALEALANTSSTLELVARFKQILTPLLSTTPEQDPSSEYNDDDLPENPPPPPPLPSHRSQIVARAKIHIAKREAQKAYETFVEQSGLQSEYHTKLYTKSRLIAVAAILDDPDFTNFRRTIDLNRLAELQESIQLEGLKLPIVVVKSPIEGYYHVRAGFRRVMAIRNLNWESIPAIVLPPDTPVLEEYWINIIENTAREKLNTYELAEAAKLMRDRFKVPPKIFAKKAGHSPDYIYDLLLCIDRLPLEVLEDWRKGAKLPLKILVKLSTLTPTEAVRNCRLWLGQRRITTDDALRSLNQKPSSVRSDRLWSAKGIERLQRLHMAIKVSSLPPETKRVCTDIVEYLQGTKKHVPGLTKAPTGNEEQPPIVDEGDLIRPHNDSDMNDHNVNQSNEISPTRSFL
jgi:ParB/RepB/Spo0J family partition protein